MLAAATAGVQLEVAGAVEPADGVLEVRVDVTNKGTAAATTLDIRAALGEESDQRTITAGIPPGGTRSAVFPFQPPPRPGIHVLGVRLDYAESAGAAGGTSQAAFLLLSIGANPTAAIGVAAGDATFELTGAVPVRITSADGRPHRARVRVLTPRGLNANTPVEVDVPATGAASADVPLIRGNVARPSSHGVVVVAETLDGDIAHAAVTTTLVHVSADPARMPGLRRWIAGLAIVLLAAAVFLEWKRQGRGKVRVGRSDGPDGHVHVDVPRGRGVGPRTR